MDRQYLIELYEKRREAGAQNKAAASLKRKAKPPIPVRTPKSADVLKVSRGTAPVKTRTPITAPRKIKQAPVRRKTTLPPVRIKTTAPPVRIKTTAPPVRIPHIRVVKKESGAKLLQDTKWNEFIASVSPTETILLTVANAGYLDLVLNMYHTLQRTGADCSRFVVLSYDKKLLHALEPYKCIRSFLLDYTGCSHLSSSAVAFKEHDWNAVTRFKLLAIWVVLQSHRNVIYCDPDIAFMRDPWPSINKHIPNGEYIHIQRGSPYCSGVICVRAGTKVAKEMFDPQYWMDWKSDDELYIKTRAVNNKNIVVQILPFDEYPNGLAWKEKSVEEVRDQISKKECVLFHYNHISGVEAKRQRMRETGAYIDTMQIISVPSKFQRCLDKVCIEHKGTTYPPHHEGKHLEEACEELVNTIHTSRLIESEYVYLPVHWTAIAVANSPRILTELQEWCASLFRTRRKLWTVVQHCKGLEGSCGIQLPSNSLVFVTSDARHALSATPPILKFSQKKIPLPPKKKILAQNANQQPQAPKPTKRLNRKHLPSGSGAQPRKLIPHMRHFGTNKPAVSVSKNQKANSSPLQLNEITVPLVSSAHSSANMKHVHRDLLASFIGKISVHPIREKLRDAFQHRKGDVVFKDGAYQKKTDTREFSELMNRSIFALCPRGFGTTSFRLTEAMEFGCIPVYVSDVFSLPFSDERTGIKADSAASEGGWCICVKENDIPTLYERLKNISVEEQDLYRRNIAQYFPQYFSMHGCCETIITKYIDQSEW